MHYKALILDLDGTTVLHGKDTLPSPRVAKAIAAAKDKIHICVATGRPRGLVQYVLDHLALSGPCILSNGVQVYDPVKRTLIAEVELPREAIEPITTIGKKYNLEIIAFDGEQETSYKGGELGKLLSLWFPDIPNELSETIENELKVIPGIVFHKSPSWNKVMTSIDATHAEASKLHGILTVSKILGIDTHEIIGVGDGYNDFPLLLACGLKIAMGNAVPELKEIADFVCPTVENDGVATVIEKIVLVG